MDDHRFTRRILFPLFLLVATLQALDSGVLRSTPLVGLMVLAGIAAPASAFALAARPGRQLASLVASLALMVAARVASPVPLPELGLVAFVGFVLFFFGQRMRARGESGRCAAGVADVGSHS